ncbi:MAG: 30S ribosome-binding factor RbfA [Pseudomonadales bacterium]|jgi:ribosome-binding factor A|nr:30S ribosome-binding factor RbfA [Pseudomonadales bacterium]
MPREYGRDQRVADFIQRELATILQFEMKDPRVGMVSVNDVRVSPDLGYAEVYVSSLDAVTPEARAELVAVLTGAAGWLRSLVAKRSQMRSTPRLRFHWDEVAERSRALDDLINRARAEDAARHPDEAGDGDAAVPEDED